MTREEAIAYFKDMNECTYGDVEPIQMAIKALDQEPCEDAVSRRAVLNTLDFTDKFLDETRTVESYKTLLEECYKNLPSVTPIHKDRTVQNFVDKCRECGKQRWIPCSERLPENETRVLTTIKIPNRIARVRSGWYDSGFFPNDHGGFFHNDNGDVWKATDMEVVAWMPLPEPYKEESEGEE